jgi:hypothetical protein
MQAEIEAAPFLGDGLEYGLELTFLVRSSGSSIDASISRASGST